jgi:DNA polymerase-3 subunit gamma/tau
MSEYLVSARKYRPSRFADVVGQDHITKTLDNAIKNNQIAHAYLFCGPRGVGKTSCARIFSELVNKNTSSNSIYNIFELDGASNNQVNDIRTLIDQVKVPPQIGKYKIYIIDEVHMLTSSAFNAFLKTLEEPPKHSIFILATTEKNKVIPTILSRCQIFDFKKISNQDIINHLEKLTIKENINADKKSLRLIAEKSDGSLRDSLSIFDRIHSFCNKDWNYEEVSQILLSIDVKFALKMTEYFIKHNIPDSILTMNNLLSEGFNAKDIISALIIHFRNLMIAKSPKTIDLLEEEEEIISQMKEQSKGFTSKQILWALNCLNECDVNYKHSINQRFLVELCVMQLCSLEERDIKKKIIIHKAEKKQLQTIENTTKNNELVQEIHHENKPRLNVENNISEIATQKIKETTPLTLPNKLLKDNVDDKKNSSKKGLSNSLFNIIKDKKEEPETDELLNNKDPDTTLTKENIHQAWKLFSDQLKNNSKTNLYNIFERYLPELNENNLIINVVNMAEQAELKEIKNKLLQFLHKTIGNSSITIDIIISKTEERNMLYTSEEKLKYLLDNNENMKLLKDRLELNII